MRQLFKSTDKKLIPALPRYSYGGKIMVVNSASEAERAVEVLLRAPLLGIDTETRPAFRRGVTHQVALLQVASEQVCFLFRLNETGLLPCHVRLLSASQPLKVGLSLTDDFHALRQRDETLELAGFLDLQTYVKPMGIEDMSLQKLYANVFRQRISKSARLSNWEADILTDAQKAYAATDAVACINLYKELSKLKASGEYEVVEGENSL